MTGRHRGAHFEREVAFFRGAHESLDVAKSPDIVLGWATNRTQASASRRARSTRSCDRILRLLKGPHLESRLSLPQVQTNSSAHSAERFTKKSCGSRRSGPVTAQSSSVPSAGRKLVVGHQLVELAIARQCIPRTLGARVARVAIEMLIQSAARSTARPAGHCRRS